MEIRLPSPAKINSFLHIVGRRPDGYHLLQTAFQFIDLSDQMNFKVRNDCSINLKTENLNLPYDDNIIVKAARLLQKMAKEPRGIDIELVKRIPVGAGLGGGSSNAATTLIILNKLWDLNIKQEQLADIGVSLGADVPIFLYGKCAFAEGIGEKLQPLDMPEHWILLVTPHCKVATAKIFSDTQLTRNTPGITMHEFLANGGHNDCEPVAKKYFPEIAYVLNCLNRYANAKMTGTGSAVFAAFQEKEAALKVAEQIPKSFKAILVKGLNNSPLHEAIKTMHWGVAKW